MKQKRILAALVLLGAVALASCDSKVCYCYDGPHETTQYTNSDTPCSSLGRGGVGCVEEWERMTGGGQAQDE